jgi:hypothetical protein
MNSAEEISRTLKQKKSFDRIKNLKSWLTWVFRYLSTSMNSNDGFFRLFGFIKNSDKSEMIASGIFNNGSLPFGIIRIMERLSALHNTPVEDTADIEEPPEEQFELDMDLDLNENDMKFDVDIEDFFDYEQPELVDAYNIHSTDHNQSRNKQNSSKHINSDNTIQKTDREHYIQVQNKKVIPEEKAQALVAELKVHQQVDLISSEKGKHQVNPENKVSFEIQDVSKTNKDSSKINPENHVSELQGHPENAEVSHQNLAIDSERKLDFMKINQISGELQPEKPGIETVEKNSGKEEKVQFHEHLSGLMPKDAKIDVSALKMENLQIPRVELAQRVADIAINLYRSGKAEKKLLSLP